MARTRLVALGLAVVGEFVLLGVGTYQPISGTDNRQRIAGVLAALGGIGFAAWLALGYSRRRRNATHL